MGSQFIMHDSRRSSFLLVRLWGGEYNGGSTTKDFVFELKREGALRHFQPEHNGGHF
jgi:hypothetical protein